MRKFLTSSVIALALLPAAARAAEPSCISAGEFTSLAGYALPSIISGTSQRCAATLPADAYLRKSGGELAARYATRKAAVWPSAKAAFLKLGSSGPDSEATALLKSMPDPTLQQMFDGMIEGLIGQRVPESRCGTIDRLVRLLAPLPPENTAELIGVAVGLGSQSGGAKVGKFSLCPA